jgi:5'-3' exoribonuclease 1
MGVPYFFREIVEKYPNIILDKNPKKCNRLFLDFNACIHTCSAIVVGKNPINYTNLDIFNEVIKYTITVVNISNPSDLLYLSIDGVPPLAKITQQRRRRYLSAHRNSSINDFKQKNNLPVSIWDSNCITPGTEFMIELDAFLKNYFKENKFPFEVILSGHDEPGEGEHKFIRYIKENNQQEYTDIILGLDCDLLFLSLGCNKSNIYLMREAEQFGKHVTNNMSNTTKQLFFKYVDIDMLRNCVSQFLYSTDDISHMYDYIFICMLCGNDFIPSMSFLKLKNGALDILCDAYKKIYSELNENIVIKNEKGLFAINHRFFVKMLEIFSKSEDSNMKEIIEQHSNIYYNPNRRFNTKLERFTYEYESMPLINRFPNVIKPHTDSNWRINYYHYLFGSHSTDIMKSATMKYIEGLLWTTNYYFNMNYDSLWYYEYDYSPCVSDLYKYSLSVNVDNFNKMQKMLLHTNKKLITSSVQMVIVLPPQSKKIVPEKYKKLYTDINLGCVHLFPTHFKFQTFLKTQTWECTPIIPKLDINHIQKIVESIS